jgi:hypothetical protein
VREPAAVTERNAALDGLQSITRTLTPTPAGKPGDAGVGAAGGAGAGATGADANLLRAVSYDSILTSHRVGDHTSAVPIPFERVLWERVERFVPPVIIERITAPAAASTGAPAAAAAQGSSRRWTVMGLSDTFNMFRYSSVGSAFPRHVDDSFVHNHNATTGRYEETKMTIMVREHLSRCPPPPPPALTLNDPSAPSASFI